MSPTNEVIYTLYEPRHDKTNKMDVRPAKTQISLGIRPVWSESSLSAWRKLGSLAIHSWQGKTLIRLSGCPGWSQSSLGAHSFCWFCHDTAHKRNQPRRYILYYVLRVYAFYACWQESRVSMVLVGTLHECMSGALLFFDTDICDVRLSFFLFIIFVSFFEVLLYVLVDFVFICPFLCIIIFTNTNDEIGIHVFS